MLTPSLVSKTVSAVKASGRAGSLDLPAFQEELYRRQRGKRIGGLEQSLVRTRHKKRRLRMRQPTVGQCNVVYTRVDTANRLYFELSNGQVVRAERVADRSGGLFKFFDVRKGRRKLPFKNSIIRAKVKAEIQKTARKESAA